MDEPKREEFLIPRQKIQKEKRPVQSCFSIFILSTDSSKPNKSLNFSRKVVISIFIIAFLSLGGVVRCAFCAACRIYTVTAVKNEKRKHGRLALSHKQLDSCVTDLIVQIHTYKPGKTVKTVQKNQEICKAGLYIFADVSNFERAVDLIPKIDYTHHNYTERAFLSTPFSQNGSNFSSEPEFICPVPGVITSKFGVRSDPVFEGTEVHHGVDIAYKIWTPVLAVSEGIVIWSGARNRFGNVVIINHDKCDYQTIYAHLQKTSVIEGQTVNKGQIIGFLGNSGKSTGPHLHYEVRRHGKPLDPIQFLYSSNTVAD